MTMTPNPVSAAFGLPFDCRAHPLRIGSRQGPASIRKQWLLIWPIDATTSNNPLELLKAADLFKALGRGVSRVRARGGGQNEYPNGPKRLAHKILAVLIAAPAILIAAIAVGWPRL
jgi:hypothetical protein